MKRGLLPTTVLVLRDFEIEIGQLTPKQINIIASKKLMCMSFRLYPDDPCRLARQVKQLARHRSAAPIPAAEWRERGPRGLLSHHSAA
ncbi:MAG: hypothetical protein HQ559_05905 [Lentisphaerae bacterium]|nr:hypothetical protein [Lentisphaerota bacterium]